LNRARAGDRDAIASLWRIYQPQILRLLVAKRARSPEDVASQVWIDVGRALGRFKGDGADFRRWIFTIANRRSIDGHRRATRAGVGGLGLERDLVARGTDELFDAEASLERALAIVRELSPATAEAVMLRVVHDLSVSDVAQIMGRSEGAVRVLVHRGLGRLRDIVGAECDLADEKNPAKDVTRDGAPALT